MRISRLAAAATAAVMTAGGLVLAGAGAASADTVDYRPARTIPDYYDWDEMVVAVDIANDGTTYTLNKHGLELRVFGPKANGKKAKPIRVLGVPQQLSDARDVAVDSQGRVYVLDLLESTKSRVRVWARGATGPVLRTLNVPGYSTDVAVSAAGHVVVAGERTVRVYAPGASGDATPLQTLSGVASGLPQWTTGVALDSWGRVWVSSSNTLLVYARGATGQDAPVATIAGSRTRLRGTAEIDLDAKNRVYVSDADAGISVFSPSRYGNVAPLRELRGRKSGLDWGLVGVNARGDVITKRSRTSIGIFRTLFPTRPSAVRSVRVTRKASAKKRTVRWKKPADDGGRDVRSYKVVIRKGSKVLKRVTLKPGRRSYTVRKSALRRGKLTVTVRAKTAKGW
ncbi:hypothetical protein KV102_17130, partial [Mumia sp. zg.B53]